MQLLCDFCEYIYGLPWRSEKAKRLRARLINGDQLNVLLKRLPHSEYPRTTWPAESGLSVHKNTPWMSADTRLIIARSLKLSFKHIFPQVQDYDNCSAICISKQHRFHHSTIVLHNTTVRERTASFITHDNLLPTDRHIYISPVCPGLRFGFQTMIVTLRYDATAEQFLR